MGLTVPATALAGTRLSYEASCKRLMDLGFLEGPLPPRLPDRQPGLDDAVAGVSFFRTLLEAVDLSGLTLPRTFFGRSEINAVNFSNTDLGESNLCWNDFLEVDFSDGSLAGADLRASQFLKCRFDRTDLRGADLRRSEFDHCSFKGARLDGAVATRSQAAALGLADAQSAVVDWKDDQGPEPDGG